MQELYNYQPPVEQVDAQVQKEGDFSLLSIPSQLLYGFLEGMTTLPVSRWAHDEPDNMVESLANSLGHLMGFVGINPIGVGGKIASKLFTKGTMGRYLSALGQHTRMPSLPMYLGNKLSSGIQSFGLKPAMESIDFLKKNPQFQDMIQSGLTLGLQSAVGGAPIYDWSVGAIEDRMKSGAMGTLFGVGNSFVGNYFTRGGKYDVNRLDPDEMKALFKSDKQAYKEAIAASDFRNGLVRASVSGAIFSTPSILMGQPLPVVLYDAALNSYFGYKESPYWMKTAKAISERFAESPDLLLNPKETIQRYYPKSTWENLDPRTKDTLQEMADLQLGGIVNTVEGFVSGPSAELGKQMFDFIKTAKVVSNNVEPKEGEIREYDYKLWKRREDSYKAYMEAVKQADNEFKDGDKEDLVTEFFRRNLTDMARADLGKNTRLGTLETLQQIMETPAPIVRGLSNKANFVIDRTYKNEGLTEIFTDSINKLVDTSFKGVKPLENDYIDRQVNVIKLTAKYAKNKNLTYNEFKNELWDKYKIEPSLDMKYAYEVANQSVPRGELTIDVGDDGFIIRPIKEKDERDHIRPVKMEPRSLFQEMLDGDGYELATFKDFIPLYERDSIKELYSTEFTGDDDGIASLIVDKLYKTEFVKDGRTYNLAVYSGHKDQSKLVVGKFLLPKESVESFLKEKGDIIFEDGNRKVLLRELHDEGLKRFLKTVKTKDTARIKELSDIYTHTFANNIAFIEKFHNKTINDIAKAGEGVVTSRLQKNYMIDPYALMKRTQGLNSHQIRVKPLDFAEEFTGLNVEKYPEEYSWKLMSAVKQDDPYFFVDSQATEDTGDSRFSALNAKLKDGRTVEEAWQQAKGTGKGQKAKDKNFSYYKTYKGIWKQWISENPDLFKELSEKTKGKVLIDRFATTDNNQARALSDILNETSIQARKEARKPKTAEDMAEYEKRRSEALNALGQHRYIILNAVNKDGNNIHRKITSKTQEWLKNYEFTVYNKETDKTEVKKFDAHLDGGELMRGDVFDALLKSVGVNPVAPNGERIGGYKGISIHLGDGVNSGMFAKKAIFRAPDKMSRWMESKNIHSIEYDTTIKIGGERTGNDYYVTNDGTPEIDGEMKIYERPWDSNTYLSQDQTYKLNKPSRLLKQLLQNIWSETPDGTGQAALKDVLTILENNIKGLQGRLKYTNANNETMIMDLSDAVSEYINYGKNDDFLTHAYETGQLGLARKLSLFLSNRDGKIWRKIRDEIFDRELDNEWGENEEGEFQYFKDFGVMNKIMDAMGDNVDPSILAAVNSSRNYVETALKRYINNELIKPKIKEVLTSTATSQFPYVNFKDVDGKPNYIKKGEFYLGNGARKQIVNAETGETLEDAWSKARTANKDLEYLVIRAPADSPSGIRALKFKGFIDADGTGIYTHPEEYFNLGGMDNDIDKVSIYFNLPKSINEYYKSMKDQWYENGIAIPAKDNPDYVREKYRTLPFDPLTNITVNRNAYSGISLLGQGLNYTNRLMVMHDWATKNNNGEVEVSLYFPNDEQFTQTIWNKLPNHYIGTSKNGRRYIRVMARLKDKKYISKHQRDIVNYAADASNGEPMQSIQHIKKIINKDIITLENPEFLDIPDSDVYFSLPDEMMTRMEILDSIYSDRNNTNKTELASGREIPSRYSVWEMLQVMSNYAADVDRGAFKKNSPNGYMYKAYETMGRELNVASFLKDNADNYRWIKDDHANRVLVSQINNFFKENEEAAIAAKFHFRNNVFGLNYTHEQFQKRVEAAWRAYQKKKEGFAIAKAGGIEAYMEQQEAKAEAEMSSKQRYKEDFTKLEEMYIKRKIESDLRANDIMDLASIINVINKGQAAILKHGGKKVGELRDKVFDLRREHSEMLVKKKEGDLNAENDWVVKTTEFFDSLNETPELREYAEAQIISTVGGKPKTPKQYLYTSFYGDEGLLSKMKANGLDVSEFSYYDNGELKYDAEKAYYTLNSVENLKEYTKEAYNQRDVLGAIYKYLEKGKNYFESGFRDGIARLPFVSTTSLGEVFTAYKGIIDYGANNRDNAIMSKEGTRKYIQEKLTGETMFDKVPEMDSYLHKVVREDIGTNYTDDIKEAGARLRDIFRRYPGQINRIEGHWIKFQELKGIRIPVTIDRMTKPDFLKFVDYLDKKTSEPSYAIKSSSWYKTPQEIGEALNFRDSRTNQVVMRVRDADGIRIVKVNMPSSRVDTSLVLADYINERRNAEYKDIERRIFSSDNEDLIHIEYEMGPDNQRLIKNGEYVIKNKSVIIHPIFIKSHLPYEDWSILERNAIITHELQNNPKLNEFTKYLMKLATENEAKFRKLTNKTYQITYKKSTKSLTPYQVRDELMKYIKASNQEGLRMLNDPLNFDRILSSKDPKLGYGIEGFQEHSIIRVTDFIEKMTNDIMSGKMNAYADLGINVHNLINWNSEVYNYKFKTGPKEYRTIEEMLSREAIYTNSKFFWQKYAEKVVELKSKVNEDGEPLYKILHNPPKRTFDIPYWFTKNYFPHIGHKRSDIEERARMVLEKAKPDSEEYKRAELYLFRLGEIEMGDTSEALQAMLTSDVPEDTWVKISSSVSNNLKARNDDFFIPGYKMDMFVYNDYFKSLAKQRLDTMLVTSHKHLMNRMIAESRQRKNSLTVEDAIKMRQFLDIRMMDVLGYPSQFPDRYVNNLKLDGTFYHKLTNDYWIRKKFGFIDKLLGIDEETPERVRAAKINRAIQSLSNIEATWAMMPLLASPKFMVTNRFSGGVTTVINAGMEYFVKAHKMAEVKKAVPEMNTYADMVDFVSKHGGIESFIKNELVLSQNVKIGDVTEFVKDVINFYKEGKEVPIRKMYELAKQRGLTQEFVDKAAYFMRASEIKNRVYAWFAHYMKAKNVLDKTGQSFDVDDPWLVSMANKGVAATQYLYDSLNRPAFARTALGKMLTRFQLFTYNNIKWRKQLMDNARYEDWNSPDGKRLGNLVAMDMMVLTLATFFPGTMFSASLNQPYGWAKDLTMWLFGDEKEREKAFFGAMPYPANIVQPILPPFTRFLINPIVALFDLEKFTSTLVWSLFPFGRLVNETRKSIDNPLLAPEKSLGIPFFSFIRKVQADYKRREKEEAEGTNPPAPTGLINSENNAQSR